MNRILTQIRKDLEAGKYVHLRKWIDNFLETNSSFSQLPFSGLLQAIKMGDISQILEEISKLYYTNLENHQFAAIKRLIEINQEDIARQWKMEEKFKPNDEFLNIVFYQDIIAFQEAGQNNLKKDPPDRNHRLPRSSGSKISSIDDLEKFAMNPEYLFHNGKIFYAKALSTNRNISGVIKEFQIHEKMEKYKKYEKIAQFIENLNYHLQSLFSFHQIGVIIYNSQIYLIKWVQFIDENQILGGSNLSGGKVKILNEFGVKIGVEIQENGELGNLVIFKNTEEENIQNAAESNLEPLLMLNPTLFQKMKRSKSTRRLDLSNPEDCEIFVNQVLSRIETGILLLSQKDQLNLKKARDLDIYIQISLEKLPSIASINQRLNLLRDLKVLNQNPDYVQTINQELEKNYINFIKIHFQNSLSQKILQILKEIRRLNLFEQNIELLLNSISYLIETYPIESPTIMEIVEFVINNWKLNSFHYKLLERPQIVAITNIVASYLNQEKFKEILTFLSNFMETHPYFKSQNLIMLLLQILQDLCNIRYISKSPAFSSTLYLKFFENVISFINNFYKDEEHPNPSSILKIKNNILLLSDNLDFIAFLNDKIGDYLNLIDKFDPKLINSRVKYQILRILQENIPFSCLYRERMQLAGSFFTYLSTNSESNEIILDFLIHFIKTLNNYTPQLFNKEELSQNTINFLIEVKNWNGINELHPILLKPLFKEFNSLFFNWYEQRNLPKIEISTHRKFINSWIDILGKSSQKDQYFDVLRIKNLIWACLEGDVKKAQKRYYNLLPEVYIRSSEVIYLEISKFLDQPCNDYNKFHILHFLFHTIQKDFIKLQLTGQKFKLILKKYKDKVKKLLENAIVNGFEPTYGKVFNEIMENLIYFSPSFFEGIYPHFTMVYEMSLSEAPRFQSRIRMVQITSSTLQNFLSKFDTIRSKKEELLNYCGSTIDKNFIERYVQKLDSGTLEIFHRIDSWLIEICSIEYIQSMEKIEPIKNIFESVLKQFSQKTAEIVGDFQFLINEIYSNQKMLIDNKKKFFKMMLDIIPKSAYSRLYRDLKSKYQQIQELSEIESKYYTIEQHDDAKIEQVRKQLKPLIDRGIQLFTPWFIYANTYALQEKHLEAIEAFKEALKYESNLSNYARLYHNLIVSHLSLNNIEESIKIIKNLEIGIKTDPIMVKLIREVEKLTEQQLLTQL